MRKIKNRFIALLVIFTSIISFLPVGFSGQAAKAADSEATTISVAIADTTNIITPTVKNDEVIYSTTNVIGASGTDGFDITVKDLTKTELELTTEAMTQKKTVTGIRNQEVIIKSINGVNIPNTDGILEAMGIEIKENTGTNLNGDEVIGKRLMHLPYGINKIEYEVKVSSQTITYIPQIKDSSGNVTQDEGTTPGEVVTTQNISNKKITIQYATDFAIKKIDELNFRSFVGNQGDFTADDDVLNKKNNEAPFIYSQTASPDEGMPLRYTFDIPDSTYMVKYAVKFKMSLLDVQIFRNGKAEQSEVTGDNNETLVGSLKDMGSSLFVLKIQSNDATEGPMTKAYAIEIKYNALNYTKDFSLENPNITKYDYNEIDSVEAYIGKKFTVSKDTSGFSVYKGDIYIDPKANLISIDPTLIVGKDAVAYKVFNNYVDSGTSGTMVENAILKSDGKKYVNFKRGSLSNQLEIDVYAGKDGNVTDSSKILARYLLNVNPITTTDNFTTDMKIEKSNDSDSIEPYLTQPGVKESIIDFTTARRTYDLYYAPESSSVRVTFDGQRSSKNEYLKVWLASDRNSTNPKEATESVNNKVDSDLKRETSLNVDLGTSEKMVVQAYYDDFQYETDPVTNEKKVKKDDNGNPICMSYPLGEKYVFYIPRNFHDSGDSSGENSNNASLSSLKLSGYTLKDSDGNEGFSSDKLDYTTTVAKEDTSAKITAIAEDDNIKSMVATIDGGAESYDLTSGELSELPLNTKGKTTIKIVVTAQDETTTKTYTVIVKNNSKGSNVNLKNVILNVGDYTFDPKEDVTKVRVDQNVSSIKVTPVPEDPKAKINVNGQEFLDTPMNVSLKGAQKTEINIEVISEDGTESKTYTLEVNRVDVADWDNDSNNGDDPNEDDQFYDDYSKCWVDLTKYDEWGTVNGKPAYFDKKNRQVKEAWITTGGKLYYLNNLGYRASGWKIDDASGKTYYLDPTTGEMKKEWMNLDNKWYYLGLNGVMQKGWLNLNNKWYYFTPNGQMVVSQTMYVDDEVFRFGQDGAIY